MTRHKEDNKYGRKRKINRRTKEIIQYNLNKSHSAVWYTPTDTLTESQATKTTRVPHEPDNHLHWIWNAVSTYAVSSSRRRNALWPTTLNYFVGLCDPCMMFVCSGKTGSFLSLKMLPSAHNAYLLSIQDVSGDADNKQWSGSDIILTSVARRPRRHQRPWFKRSVLPHCDGKSQSVHTSSH
jgi:hypothetical protein